MNKTVLFIGFSMLILFSYQNCGEVNLQAPIEQVELESISREISGELCPITGANIGLSSKTIFAIDMSSSNLGGAIGRAEGEYAYTHTLGIAQDPPRPAADEDGLRFSGVADLINSISSVDADFSIIGFHDNAIFGQSVESCQSDFIGRSQAISANNSLRSLHMADRNNPVQYTQNPTSPFNLKGTSYKEAIDCIVNKIQYSLYTAPTSDLEEYNIVFITDGKPSDAIDPCRSLPEEEEIQCYQENPEFLSCRSLPFEQRKTCVRNAYASGNFYTKRLEQLEFLVRDDVLGINFFPIYYGPEEELEDAKNILDRLGQVFDPQIETLVLDDISELSQELNGIFETEAKVSYLVRNFSALNLTALPRQGKLLADANMNGVADELEEMNEESIRNIYNSYSENFNADSDLIPSFVEKIRGLSTSIADDDLDLDADSINNLQELNLGMDIRANEEIFTTPKQHRIASSVTINTANTCAPNTPTYDFNISHMPLIEELIAFNDPNPSTLDFSHEANENVILLYYIAEPMNGNNANKYLFAKRLKVKANEDFNISVDFSTFTNLGELE